MIEVVTGNVLLVARGIIVHGCNTEGVMGAGIALSIKNQFPKAYALYRQEYEQKGLSLGEIQPILVEPEKYIVNAMTQGLGEPKARQVSYDAIEECFSKINGFALSILEQTSDLEAAQVVFPKIGAGLGGGNWQIIEAIIDATLEPELIKKVYVL